MNPFFLIIKIYVIAGGFAVVYIIHELIEYILEHYCHNENLSVLLKGLRWFLVILAFWLIPVSLGQLTLYDIVIW